ncbi:hypothetical protein PAAG_00903 [Paracoccidioides lutzii Pb01]|uniref:CWH43-like N-terminal domain-containing protein n=1 Tax=Paracoccidioides lutzii (strain ATCC MYA-826 / Pb01) TaxID=502779 RepID=C1GQV8_PARBA|nr:hypothetical protein PAAG_00903 [Paracoccidioides lutzii Pb01]EEH37982.1 hypothetical protein PAAG_00903 [Paracoccidioides lutzii Pb01]
MGKYQNIAYISDVGAQRLKPLFIGACTVTSVLFTLSFMSERWLRHTGQLARNKGKWDKGFAITSIVFSMFGGLGLILLSIFDTLRFPILHNGCLFLFMGGYILSAVFVCAEYQRLGIYYRQHTILAASFWTKLAFIFVEFSLAITFIVTGKQEKKKNIAAVMEWIIGYIFTFYVFSFIIDLLPSVRTRNHIPQGKRISETNLVNAMQQTSQPQVDVHYEQPLTTDSMGDRGNADHRYIINKHAANGGVTEPSAIAETGGYVPSGQLHDPRTER